MTSHGQYTDKILEIRSEGTVGVLPRKFEELLSVPVPPVRSVVRLC